MKIYIDESGNLGEGDSDFFTIAAVIFENKNAEDKARRIIRAAHKRYFGIKTPNEEIKFNRLNSTNRKFLLNKLNGIEGLRVCHITIQKSKVKILKIHHKNLVYNFFAGIVAENIMREYNGDIEFIFDQRSTAIQSRNSLCDYIITKSFAMSDFSGVVSVCQMDSKGDKLLQVADLAAGSIFRFYKTNDRKFIDIINGSIKKELCDEFPSYSFGRKYIDKNTKS